MINVHLTSEKTKDQKIIITQLYSQCELLVETILKSKYFYTFFYFCILITDVSRSLEECLTDSQHYL